LLLQLGELEKLLAPKPAPRPAPGGYASAGLIAWILMLAHAFGRFHGGL
jgi:hypothetical protein